MPDRYTPPGSDILVNKLCVTDYHDWEDAEADFIGDRMGALREHPILGGYDLAHCRPQFIVPEAERVFDILTERNHLRQLGEDEFSEGVAWARGETTAIPPFRDVHTRTQHVFFNQLARDAGWVIDWLQIPADVFAHARTDPLRDRMAERARGFQAWQRTRDPQTLDPDLDAARRRRGTLLPIDPRGEDDSHHSGLDRSGPGLGP